MCATYGRGSLAMSFCKSTAFALACATAIPFTTSVAAEKGIEEVVVTAQRRAENLQSVPIAVSAFSEEALRTQGIDSLTEVATRTPGFSMGTFNVAQPQLFIRGIGSNDDGAGADSSVVVFIDEVYVGRNSGTAMDLFDLERVEVLRGPQGTLYGKNVVGGAINLVTRKPDEEFRAKLEGTFGNFDLANFRGFASGPLAENVFGKIAFSSKKREGYLDSEIGRFPQFFGSIPPEQLGQFEQLDEDTESIRAHLRFTPTDRLEINLTADRSELRQSGPARYTVGGPNGRILAGLIEDDIYTNLATDPGISDREINGYMGRVDYDFDFATFTSITAYREADAIVDVGDVSDEAIALLASSPNAQFGDALINGANNTFRDESEQLSQEFRLTSAGEGPVDWVLGAYFLKEEVFRVESFDLGFNLALGDGTALPLLAPTTGSSYMDNETEGYAFFGQASWQINDQWRITAGGRYTDEEKTAKTRSVAGGFLVLESFDVQADDSWAEFTPKVSVDFQLNDDVFFYGTVSKGYKSGGFQGSPPVERTATTPYDKEIAWLYEVGAKTEWFDNRLRLNLSLFQTDYEDLQVFQLLVPADAPDGTPGVLTAQNAADAEIKGAEFEFIVMPLPNLTLRGSYTYLDTEYAKFTAPAGFRTPGGVDPTLREGNRLRNAPEHAFNILAVYDILFENGASLALQADYRKKTRVFQDPDNERVASIPGYDVLDARIAYTTANGQWEVAGWMKNALDEEYFLHNFPVSGSGAATPAPPRMMGITFTWMTP